MSARQTLYRFFEAPVPRGSRVRLLRLSIQLLIVLNILAVVLESIDELQQTYQWQFHLFESISVAFFTIEYLVRLWTSAESSVPGSPWKKRLHFITSPMPLIDLLAFLPFYLTFVTIDLRFVRAFRLFRLFRIAKMARYWDSLTMFARVFRSKRAELGSSFLVFLVFLTVNSGCIYFAERGVAGSPFSSIPAAMWWGVITMTTVGYGDMVPVTVIGKLFGAFTAIVGVALFAIFAGVMVSGFSEELALQQAKKRAKDDSDPAV